MSGGDLAAVPAVFGKVDRSHPPAPELGFPGLRSKRLSDWGIFRLYAQAAAGPDSGSDCYRFCYGSSAQTRAFWGREAGTDAR